MEVITDIAVENHGTAETNAASQHRHVLLSAATRRDGAAAGSSRAVRAPFFKASHVSTMKDTSRMVAFRAAAATNFAH